jgi:hypothetical protein
VQKVQDLLRHDEISFKICTFLLSMTSCRPHIQTTLQEQAHRFCQTFHLEDCLIRTGNGQIFNDSSEETYEESMQEWFRILNG